MQINLIVVGDSKEKYWNEATKEYQKRLTKFCKLKTYVLKDQSNKKEPVVVLKKEAEAINNCLEKIGKTHLICLAIEGKQMSSEKLSTMIDTLKVQGISQITFLIGGSLGIAEDLKQQANFLLSFSQLTFPHQMFKVILLEQLYRAFKISANEAYHK